MSVRSRNRNRAQSGDQATAGPTLVAALAISLHVRRKEYSAVSMTGLVFLAAIFVVYSRSFLVP